MAVGGGVKERVADVVVIGAGMAGLAAAVRLAERGRSVVVLEAKERAGGRILTEEEDGWPEPVELGAEFIHGGNAALERALRAAGIAQVPLGPWQWVVDETGRRERVKAWDRIDAVMRRIGPRFRGSFAKWLKEKGGGLSGEDGVLACKFVEGFQGAPASRMSAPMLFEATKHEEEQARPKGGYGRLVKWYLRRLAEEGGELRLGRPVTRVRWRRREVVVRAGDEVWRSRAGIVTLPLGVLGARRGEGVVRFSPRLGAKENLWRALETGNAVRVVLRMRGDVWRRGPVPAEMRAGNGRAFGFVQSGQKYFPVWWSAAPQPVIVGWTGGAAAKEMGSWSERRIAAAARTALAGVLGCGEAALARAIVEARMHNWTADPFARGAYSFSVAGKERAPEQLARAVQGTLFFAGEATSDPIDLGTVHGALASGERAAKEVEGILKSGIAKSGN